MALGTKLSSVLAETGGEPGDQLGGGTQGAWLVGNGTEEDRFIMCQDC